MHSMQSRFGAPWTTPAAVVTVILVGFGLLSPAGKAQDPQLGRSVTFVVTSPQELRVAPPPDDAATEVELGELKSLAGRRNDATNDRIGYWSTGAAYRWNQIAAAELLARGVGTPFAARHIALVNVAIHDAVLSALASKESYRRARPKARDPDLVTARPTPGTTSYPSDEAAAAAAASDVLASLFPDKADVFWRMAEEAAQSEVLSGIAYPSDVGAGHALGHEVAARVIARGKSDGFDAKWTGSVPKGPGTWNGTDPVAPLAGTWRPWVLSTGDTLRPPPPPAFDSPQMRAELDELKAIKRTPAMLSAAWFWEYGAGGFRGWHFWNEQATRRILEHGLAAKPQEAVRVLALESVALHDSVVACFDAKYAYWGMRPFMIDPEFKALFPAPNHPSYPAAHGCLSTAAAVTLAALFPRDAEELRAMARQAAEARMWAGIHFRSDIMAGQKIGEGVAERVIAFAIPPAQQ